MSSEVRAFFLLTDHFDGRDWMVHADQPSYHRAGLPIELAKRGHNVLTIAPR